MSIVAIQEVIDKLPLAHLQTSLQEFLQPLTTLLPDEHLKRVAELGIAGIIAAQSPLISRWGGWCPAMKPAHGPLVPDFIGSSTLVGKGCAQRLTSFSKEKVGTIV